MKTSETKTSTNTAAQVQKTASPFFSKEGAVEPMFFGGAKNTDAKFFSRSAVQPKLKIGKPDDMYERQADSVADQVVQKMSNEQSAITHYSLPIAHVPSPSVQKKCEACEKEDKLQKKEDIESTGDDLQMKPIFDSAADPPDEGIQRKPIFESNASDIQRKEGGSGTDEAGASADISARLSASRGGGSPLPDNSRSSMENAMGADFSNVRIHTGSEATQMSQELNAQAFTHGNDIYFNEGKYSPSSTEGSRLLAHELVHTVQQGKSSQISKKISNNTDNNIQKLGFEDLKWASPLYWQYRASQWVGGKAWQGVKSALNQAADFHQDLLNSSWQGVQWAINKAANFQQDFLNRGKDVYYDIQGVTSYSPDVTIWLYILNYFENNRTNKVPVKIKYGNMGRGTIIVEADSGYNLSTNGKYLIGIDHPALQVDSSKQAVGLEVEISDNIISGEIGVPKGRTGEDLKQNVDVPIVNYGGFSNKDLFHVILGEAYDGENFKISTLDNKLWSGYIYYIVAGYLDIQHQHKILCVLSIIDAHHSWLGELDTSIKGTEAYKLMVERLPGGLLSAESEEMKLDSKWNGEGFTLDGGLHIVYSNKTIEIYGTAKYKSKRAEGSITIAVVPESKAELLFRQHVPVKNTEELSGNKKDDKSGNTDDPLALTAWGDFHFKLIDKAKTLSGDAAFAVSPEGYIVTTGQIKLQKDFILMDKLTKEYVLFEDEMSTTITVAGVPVKLSLRGDITAGYVIGPISMYELTASGVYSNHRDYASELCLDAKFEMPAQLYIQLNLVASAGIGVWKLYLIDVGGTLNAKAALNAYVNAKPSIGLNKIGDSDPEYCLSGKLNVGGALEVSLNTGVEISIFKRIKTEDGGEEKEFVKKKDSFANWVIGNFGFELDTNYVLGSGVAPEFKYKGGKFDKAGFLKALRRKSSSSEKADPKLKGGFEQEGEQKGVVSDESIKDKEIDESGQPLGPFELVEDFNMNGTPHKLYLVVSGTEGSPVTKLEMASHREDLTKKIDEEIALLEDALSSAWFNLTDDQEKKIEMQINRLIRMKGKAELVKSSVKTNVADPATPADISAPGFEVLDDEIGDFGNQFGVNDLGTAKGGIVNDSKQTDNPPADMEIILVLPPQKTVHFSLYKKMINQGYLQHSVGREERDTDQQTEWDNIMVTGMPRGTYCQGRGLGLTEVDILRPYWSKRYLDASRKSRKKPRESVDIPRMQVDHTIEWQVRPIAGAAWLDQPWNYELLDASSNGSSGPKMKGNIDKERERLATQTGDNSWIDKDITFTKVITEGNVAAERWSYEEIEDGEHLDAYRILTGETVDPEKEKTC